MNAITLWPEWAWAVTRLGKNVENRRRRTSLEIGSELAIHAGASFGGTTKYQGLDKIFGPVSTMASRAGWRLGFRNSENIVQCYNTSRSDMITAKAHRMPRRSVVAVAIFAGMLEPGKVLGWDDDVALFGCGDWPWWAGDQFGYILQNVKVLPEPVPCRGQQGLWILRGEKLERVRAQL